LWGNANCPQPQKTACFLNSVSYLANAKVGCLVVQSAQVVFLAFLGGASFFFSA
jgi:hypothetical protein